MTEQQSSLDPQEDVEGHRGLPERTLRVPRTTTTTSKVTG